MAIELDREQWLSTAADILGSAFLGALAPYRVTCGLAPGRRGGKEPRIEARPAAESSGGIIEVFVDPRLESSMAILAGLGDTLAAANGYTAISMAPADERVRVCSSILKALGEYPHARMLDSATKQSTRMLKVYCGHCHFVARASAKHCQRWEVANAACPVCATDLTFNV